MSSGLSLVPLMALSQTTDTASETAAAENSDPGVSAAAAPPTDTPASGLSAEVLSPNIDQLELEHRLVPMTKQELAALAAEWLKIVKHATEEVMHMQIMIDRTGGTMEALARNGVIDDQAAVHKAIFDEIHRRGNRLASQAAILRLFARYGVSQPEFERVWNSFEVDQKLRVAQDLARRYSISSTPTIVVNGKYRTGAGDAGSYPNLLELINELILRESLR